MGVDAKLTGVPQFDQLELIKVGYTSVDSDGSPTNITTVAHNLGFVPIIFASLNHIDTTDAAVDGDAPLPTFGELTVNTGTGVVELNTAIYAEADMDNAYIILFNATGLAVSSLPIKYYLLREKSS